ncbi:MAG: NAD(P)/FAD-dependent oxidoreductase [Candidatus Promineifilaceae bacterium]|nr:NAD(P)/FAD-dependent oxidoreductase [Candidatus Promineifilaceae bacterium]
MTQKYDVIIVGAGHNGLVTAALLAREGFKTLVVEQREVMGGAAATEEVFPGFRIDTGADDASLFHDEIIRDLSLSAHGLTFHEPQTALFAPQPDGSALTLWRDVSKSAAEISRFSPQDAERFPDFAAQIEQFAGTLHGMMLLTPPELLERKVSDATAWGKFGWNLRRMGSQEMMEFMRVLPMPAGDYLAEWFESPALKGALAAPSVMGNQLGVRGSGTNFMLLYQHSAGFLRRRAVVGGMGRLSAALAAAAEKQGAEIRLGTAVDHILLTDTRLGRDDRAAGVVLADGTTIEARVVVSNADPRRTFLGLVGPTKLEPRFTRQVRNILYRGVTAKINLALSALPQFKGQTEPAQLDGRILISPSLEYLERAYDAAKYGHFSPNPLLVATIPTRLDPGLAPDGRHIMSIIMQYAPYQLREGGWRTSRERLGDAVLDTLTQYAPGLPDLVLKRQVVTPLDWEKTYALTEGSINHGQMSLDQLLIMRPVSGWSRYGTPVENLFLCGAGTHPGGGVTGAPGYNAAREVLKCLKNGA